ncbi:sensor domain-containing protein [Halosegnis marinus]|uniref:Sensor domain-containing protein n=1 Tax=Halosegnis marinus TaxID=3034023 RepID=A0ABD5ZRQ5_9EURY|nr:sensor domain-containing protein [Halosegnis sp. DT85]
MSTNTTRSTIRATDAFQRVMGAPFRGQTYRNLLYLALALPLGLGYFVGLVTGVALGVGLLITLVGLPILLVTLSTTTLAASLEAWLATRLVGVEASVPAVLRESTLEQGLVLPGDGFLDAVRRLLTAPSTWTSVVLVLSKFVFGIVSFVALVTSAAVTATLIAAPFVYEDATVSLGLVSEAGVGAYSVGPWVIDTLPEALVVAAGGLVLGVLALNLLNLLTRVQARYTAALLRVDAGGTA